MRRATSAEAALLSAIDGERARAEAAEASAATALRAAHHEVDGPIRVTGDLEADGDASEIRPARVVAVWGGVFTRDLPAGFWNEGGHTYQISGSYSLVSFTVSPDAPPYDGSVLLRPMGQWYRTGDTCDRMNSTFQRTPRPETGLPDTCPPGSEYRAV